MNGISLIERVALVTGGAGAIGRSVVTHLLEAGARVICVDRPGVRPPAGAQAIEADVSDPVAVRSALAGLEALDIVVHCAGITRDAALWKMEDEDWSHVLRVNLDSGFHLLKAATPLLRRSAAGTVVLIASINGQRGKRGQANYAASKGGLIALGKTAALELGRFGIRVNCVAPGWIETPMTAQVPDEYRRRAIEETPLGRLGQPEDVASAVLFLASDMARHVTGQVLRVDGGQLTA